MKATRQGVWQLDERYSFSTSIRIAAYLAGVIDTL